MSLKSILCQKVTLLLGWILINHTSKPGSSKFELPVVKRLSYEMGIAAAWSHTAALLSRDPISRLMNQGIQYAIVSCYNRGLCKVYRRLLMNMDYIARTCNH